MGVATPSVIERSSHGVLIWAVIVGLLSGVVGCGFKGEGPPQRIILVLIDTLRRDHLSCYGSKVRTPHIDAVARRGQIFVNAYSSFHQTSMSMASLFTGRTPSLET